MYDIVHIRDGGGYSSVTAGPLLSNQNISHNVTPTDTSIFDKYFSGVYLLLDLFRAGLYVCGTLRTNQGFPSELKTAALYNKKMGGVDHNDQLRGYYHVLLKCRK